MFQFIANLKDLILRHKLSHLNSDGSAEWIRCGTPQLSMMLCINPSPAHSYRTDAISLITFACSMHYSLHSTP